MEYKVIMPVLSDTMDKGKLVKWHVQEGDKVKEGDVIAEVESDKAIMNVQTFKNGIVKKLLVKEGDKVPVKSAIAIIDTKTQNPKFQTHPQKKTENKENSKPKPKTIKKDIKNNVKPQAKILNLPKGVASPAAKKLAAKYNIDIEKLQHKNTLPLLVHENDIKNIVLNKFFTPKAVKLMKDYNIDTDEFKLNHKIKENEVLKYIKENNIPKITELTPNQKSVIKTVENSCSKPAYFVFDEVEITKIENIKLTANIIKALGNAMQTNPLARSVLKNGRLLTYSASNISVAVSRNDGLFMAVIKNVEEKSLEEINSWLKEIKTKRLTIDDIDGSTFGISNLGMFNIKQFTALINDKDCGILAIGSLTKGKIKISFTFDHRIIDGLQASKFVNDFKTNLKEIK